MTPEDMKKLAEAEKAMRNIRGGKQEFTPAEIKALDKPLAQPVNLTGREVVTLDGKRIPTEEYMNAEFKLLKNDLNGILDGYDKREEKTRTLEVVEGDRVLGKIDGLRHRTLEKLIKLCSIRDQRGHHKNIALTGETGGGKSTASAQVAEALGLECDYLGQTDMPHDVMGSVNPVTDVYKSTKFVDRFIHGGVIVLEEMDAWSPRATLVTNVPLANGYIILPNGEKHARHKDCVIIACMNTWGLGATVDYVGRNKLDAAYLDRFGIKLDWGYDEDLERAAANNDDVVEFVQTARYNAKKKKMKVIISPRSSIDIADMVRHGFSIKEAAEMNFLSSLDREQRKMVMEGTYV